MGKWEPTIKWKGNGGLAQYAKGIPRRGREALYRFVNEGLAPPDGLPSFTRDEIWDPRREIQRQMDSRPGFLEALLRDRIKKIRSGVLAGPIPEGLLARIGGEPVIVMPSQDLYLSNLALMELEQNKTHLRYDSSRNPIGRVTLKKRTNSFGKKDLSSFYSKGEKTGSFAQYRDKAAFCAAFDAAGKYDITGYFHQCRAHKDLRRYQAELLPIGGGSFAVYINMNIMFGNTKAVSWCRKGFSTIHRALDTIEPEVFSTTSFRPPSSFDLKTIPSSLRESRRGRREIPLSSSAFREGGWFDNWKKMSDRPQAIKDTIESSLIFVGNTVVGAMDRGAVPATEAADERIKKAVGYLRAHGIKISEAEIEPAAESLIVTGTELNFRNKTLSFPAEKWHAFDEKVRAVTEAKGEVSIETILRATGVAVQVSNLFRPIKAYLVPICRWAALYAFIPEGNTFERLNKRRILKETRLKVPKILRDLLARGWRVAQERKVTHCRHLLASRRDATCIISADVVGKEGFGTRTGMGAINLSTQQMFRASIDDKHPLANWSKDCQESCCALGALEVLTRPGDIVILHEHDKMTFKETVSSPGEVTIQAPFAIRFAQICDEKNLIVLPQKETNKKRDTRPGAIRVAPSSRWVFPKERGIFDKRCGDWGVDPKRIEVIRWNWRRTYETWMKIQTNYSSPYRQHTI